ncbi:hypothetical protein [Streptomyces liangshanensis]|uniref:hypothetical protein n=1 Tax=Streptomyces liangshanensis TaxID=2717324 RepID=UPI0036D8E7BE
MTLFLGLGVGGIALLILSLVLDGVLEGAFGGVLNGFFDGLLSLPVIAGFVSMLGFCGAIVLGTTDLGVVAAVAAGAVAGAVAAVLTWRFSRALMRSETTATPRGDDLLGTSGTVVTPIPASGYGEVLLRLGGQPVKFAAKSREPVGYGAEVWVEATLSSTAVSVRPVQR